MTHIGVMRIKYSEQVEIRPSRFLQPHLYIEWCERADQWAKGQL